VTKNSYVGLPPPRHGDLNPTNYKESRVSASWQVAVGGRASCLRAINFCL